jgi:hypothetical protein
MFFSKKKLVFYEYMNYMNFLPGKKYGVPSENFVKKMFCIKKVTKLPDLTVPHSLSLHCHIPVITLQHPPSQSYTASITLASSSSSCHTGIEKPNS